MIEFSKDHSSAWMEMMSAYQVFREKLFEAIGRVLFPPWAPFFLVRFSSGQRRKMNEEPSPIGRMAAKKNERRTPPPNGGGIFLRFQSAKTK